MKLNIILFIVFALAIASCKTQRQTTFSNYLQTITDSNGKNIINMPDAVIRRNDMLSIKVYSFSADPKTDAPYNLPEQTVVGSNTMAATAGFLVSAAGDIEYPRIGKIHVEGLTKEQLADIIRSKFANELTNPSVIVRFLNYKVTVLGEVKSPGSFTLPTERVTILDALGLAGDVTDFGNKNIVKVARENNGVMEIGSIDLTSKDLFNSPYFRLQQNDVVFVEQNKRKIEQQEQQVTAQKIGIITSIASTLAIIFSVIKR